jgi:uncharacterized GH25 family protein
MKFSALNVGAVLIALLPAVMTCQAPFAESPPDSRAIRGQVVNAEGEPLSGATVRVLQQGLSMDRRDRQPAAWIDPIVIQTEDDGSFVAAGLSSSEYVVRAVAPGYAPTTVTAVLAGNSLTLPLQTGHAVRGNVLDAATGRPVPGATIVACDVAGFDFGREACLLAEAGESGGFLLTVAPAGELQLRAHAAGHAVSAVHKIEVPVADEQVVTFRLQPGARVEGRVVDEKRRPVAGARIYVRPLSLNLADVSRLDAGWTNHSDEEGRFALAGVPSGAQHTVHGFRSDRGVATAGPIKVEAGQDLLDVELSLPGPALLTLRLVDEQDSPLADFELFLRENSEDPGDYSRPLDSDWIEGSADGHFTVRVQRRNGTFDLLLVPERYTDIELSGVELEPGRTTDLGTLVALEGPSVDGVVVDDGGDPIENATVRASWAGHGLRHIRRALTDGDGRYEISGLGQFLVKLEADAAGFLSMKLDAVSPGVQAADFTLLRLGGLAGGLELDDGEVPPAFMIVVHIEAASLAETPERYVGLPRQETFSAEDGSYRIDDLPPGRYTVEGRASDRAPDRQVGVQVAGGEVAGVATLVLGMGLSVQGRVVALVDGEPLAGAEVEARLEQRQLFETAPDHQRFATTDEEGRFRITGLEAGSLMLRARHPEFAPAEQRVELQQGAADADVILGLSSGGTLRGGVRGADGEPAAGRRIAVKRETDVDIGITDEQGRYELQRLMPGSYSATLLPASGAVTRLDMKTAVIRESEVTILDFDETRRISLSGTVFHGGQPVTGAEMFFANTFSLTDFSIAHSDSEGRYEVGLQEPGRYRVLLETGPAGTSGGASTEITVPDELHVIQDIHLGGDGVSGTVLDSESRPLAGAVVSASPDGAGPNESGFLVAATDAQGQYSIQGLRAGVYRVTATAVGFRIGEAYPVEIAAGSDGAHVDFKLEAGNTMRGRVVDEFDRGLASVAVVAGPAGSVDSWGAATAVTDINGTFQLTAPVAGPIDCTALPGGWAPVRLTGVLPPAGDEDTQLILRASRGGTLRMQVVGPDGAPRSGVHVSVRAVPPFLGSELIQLLTPPAPTDASGSTRLEHLLPWTYEVLASGVVPVQVTVHEGAETLARLEIP